MKFLLILLLLTPFHLKAQTIAIDGFAAMVNGVIITAGDVLEFTAAQRREARRRYSGRQLTEEQARIFDEGLDRLVENRLILESYKALGAQLPEGAVRERTDTILRERFNNDRNQLLAALRAAGTTEREWRNELRDQVIVQQLTQQFVTRRIQVTPSMVKARFEADPGRFKTPVEVRLQVLALRPVSDEQLDERIEFLSRLHRELKDGADFSEIIIEHSQGPNAQRGGDQGWMRVEALPSALREAVAELEPGRISEPLFTPTQHFIIKLTDRRGGERQTLAQAQPTLEAELRREQFDTVYAEWIASLRRQFPVTYFTPQESTIQRSN
ncbi:MAG: peptidyl-prolyl cis-trans isomerase [Verrucomicrobia bacterium]|nr:peptidyl-prolyl cis-trans isomerase [Verrucomicrobiota bacterium]MCH8527381.1 peptidyl-prolyl cis-trans isomerase [Kiritimatiellia bacterium]